MKVPADLLADIGARAAEIEEARRLPADLASRLAAAGLFRMAVPKALGGAELPPADLVRTIEQVAEADASVGWCVMIGATTALSLAWLDPDVARGLFTDPDMIFGGVFAPMGKATRANGNWRVTGKWSWASGSANCAWLFGGCRLLEGGAPRLLANGALETRMMIMPASDIIRHDSWHAAGLKGTGSGDMEARDVAVPAERSVGLVTDKPCHAGALYCFPVFGLLALGIAGAASGNARAALEALKAGLGQRRPQGSTRSAAERATVQAELAGAEARLLAARALLFETLEAAYETARDLGEVDLDSRARLRLAATYMVRTAADVTRTAYDLGGGSALYLESPLQRRFRDAHAMTQHVMVQPATLELAGRVLLKLPTDTSLF